MKVNTEFIKLQFKYPFKTARLAPREFSESLIVSIQHDNCIGEGEIRPSEYYFNENFDVAKKVISEIEPILGDNPFLLEDILDEIKTKYYYAPATLAGIDIALHDLVGKLLGIPLYKYFGLNPNKTPISSFTIGIDTIPIMIKKLKEASNYPIIKVKVGVPEDLDTMKAIRDVSDATIRVDANTGWTVKEAITKINQLESFNIEFIEQPIKPKDFKGLQEIRRNTNIPIMADEDSVSAKDLPNLVGCVDSINIKLMKCGGIREAKKMIDFAHIHGMKVMLGCMLESSLSIAAAAHLSPLVEYADLDTNVLSVNDPYDGMGNLNGKLILPDGPGLGVSKFNIGDFA